MYLRLLLVSCVLALVSDQVRAQDPPASPKLDWFFAAVDRDERVATEALEKVAAHWDDRYAALIVDLAGVLQKRDDGYAILERLTRFLKKQTGENWGLELKEWRQWLSTLPYSPHPQYADFKGILYEAVDPRMRSFFPPGVSSRIRLDQVEWGGVRLNGIPPLDQPEHVAASEANYLKGSHVVFGVEINGKARAYPKRILAWHEMARDRLGGVELTLVYCTLCGSVIPYGSEVSGRTLRFGTSGLLFRSNKLMFDEETMSLWSSLDGSPVIGSLLGAGLKLQPYPVVTTTWKEWKEQHQETTVLTLNTGHDRDYSEGAAYRKYFSTEELMFAVPQQDNRLKNKDEVLVMNPRSDSSADEPLAISVRFLKKKPVFHFEAWGRKFVVLTTPKGANRVYESGAVRFERYEKDQAWDGEGRVWRVTEGGLQLELDPEQRLIRIPASRAFWFGWYGRYPNTRLIAPGRKAKGITGGTTVPRSTRYRESDLAGEPFIENAVVDVDP